MNRAELNRNTVYELFADKGILGLIQASHEEYKKRRKAPIALELTPYMAGINGAVAKYDCNLQCLTMEIVVTSYKIVSQCYDQVIVTGRLMSDVTSGAAKSREAETPGDAYDLSCLQVGTILTFFFDTAIGYGAVYPDSIREGFLSIPQRMELPPIDTPEIDMFESSWLFNPHALTVIELDSDGKPVGDAQDLRQEDGQEELNDLLRGDDEGEPKGKEGDDEPKGRTGGGPDDEPVKKPEEVSSRKGHFF